MRKQAEKAKAFQALHQRSIQNVLETERLIVRKLTVDDAEFILRLLNEPPFLHYIGDKGVQNLDDARRYILTGPIDSYQRNGFGLYLVALRESLLPIGVCGLVKRDGLSGPDIGFALLPHYWSNGYALESASAVMTYAREVLGLSQILAIASPDNECSIKLLGKLGLRFERRVRLAADSSDVKLFTSETPSTDPVISWEPDDNRIRTRR